jgi:hypothetical protein
MCDEQKEGGKDLQYRVYLDERKALVEAEKEGAHFFDKAILTLTAGAFGLSLTFIRQIVPTIRPYTKFLLILGWAGFCFSLLSTLVSFLTSQAACRRQREILKSVFCNEGREDKNVYGQVTQGLNIFSICAFVAGVVFLALFVILNLT